MRPLLLHVVQRQFSVRGLIAGSLLTVIAMKVAMPVQAVTVIPSSSTNTVTLSSDTAYQLNSGTTVSATAGDSIVVNGIAPVTFTNAGSILGSPASFSAGIHFFVNGTLVNQATGRITGLTHGVRMDGSVNNVTNLGDISVKVSHAITYSGATSGTIDNFGTLNGGLASAVGAAADGVDMLSSGTVTVNNHAGAIINSGVGDATFGRGVRIETGSAIINNDGTINGYHEGIGSFTTGVVNIANSATGVITGNLQPAVRLQQGSSLVNNGSISSTTAAAVLLTGSNNSVTLGTGSDLNGSGNSAILSQGTGNTLTLTGTGSEDGNFTASTPANGFSQLTSPAGSDWTLTGRVAMNGASPSTVSVNGRLVLGGALSINDVGGTTIGSAGTLQIGNGGTTGSVTGSIADNGILIFNRSDTVSFGGIISGTGSVTKLGAGVLTLTASNTYTGPTILGQGVLAFSSPNNLGTLGNAIVFDGGTLRYQASGFGFIGRPVTLRAGGGTVDTNGFSSEYRGVASGVGALTKIGAGTYSLTGANTYTGGTTISAGTLQIGNGGTTGSVVGNIIDNAALVFNRSDTLGYAGIITGTGSLTQAGTGTTTLTGVGSSVASANVTSGTLNLAQSGAFTTTGNYTTGNGAITQIATNSTLAVGGAFTQAAGSTLNVALGSMQPIISAATASLAGTLNITGITVSAPNSASALGSTQFNVIHTSGGITNDFALVSVGGSSSPVDYLTLTGHKSASGLDYNVGPGLTWLAGAARGNGVFTLTSSNDAFNVDVVLSDQPASSVPWDGRTLTKNGAGTLTLSAANTYTGGTTINAGTLQIGNGGTTGSVAGNITDNAALVFNRSDNITYGGMVSGTGTLTQAGTGTAILAGNNTYSGGTAIAAGTLQLGNGGTTGSIVGDVADNGILAVNRSDSVTLGGVVSGTGSLSQLGTGTTILNGNNTYSGGTLVSAGALAVGDTSHAGASLGGGGAVTVNPGATLGGYGSITGNVTSNGTISVANALTAFAGSPNGNLTINGNVVNAGLAQIAGSGVGNTLTVAGNYVGQNATAALNTQLGADNSPSDRIVISGGRASGTTALDFTHVGGTGGLTVADGIQVVRAASGTTASGAFTQGNSVSAGAYTYALYHGGVSAGTQDNWYLRSSLPPQPPTVTPTPPGAPPAALSVPVVAAGAPVPQATSPPGTTVPIYRMEVPIYAEIPSLARELVVQQIGTFHDRQGSQDLLTENGTLPAGWGRLWGDHTDQAHNGAVNQKFDGTIAGGQVGQDVYADTTASGHRNHYGFFLGFARATGDVNGFALAQPDFAAGHLSINSYSFGGYWTHIGPGGWYTDTVLMGSTMTIDPRSKQNVGATTHGNAFTASVEAGLPIPLPLNLSIEPQAQLIYQHTHINDLNDGVSTVSFHSASGLTGRLGVRLQGQFSAAGMLWAPYVRVNVLRYFGGTDSATFAGNTVIPTSVGQTEGHVGAGISARLNNTVSVYATAGYWFNLGGAHQRTVGGNAGVRWAW